MTISRGNSVICGFAGFVLGWNLVPDFPGPIHLTQIATAYLWPLGGTLTTLTIYGLARRITGSEQDAEDVTQQTFLSAMRKLDGFRGDASFATWLASQVSALVTRA